MAIIGFVTHETREEAKILAEDTALWLEASGHEVRLLAPPGVSSRWGCSPSPLANGIDLAVSLGGDGTMLRTVDLVCGTGVPVLGVNVGHLGYLTEVDPDGLRNALKRFFAGDYRIEERMTLYIEVMAASPDIGAVVYRALNDVVLQRTTSGHTIRLAVTLGGEPFLTYAADSMIVASPTGSTAYNLSARGPIVSPRARLIVVTPVAAHMLFDRALVLAATEVVGMELIEGRQAELVVDGQSRGVLSSGDLVLSRAGDYDARLVTFGERDFHHILKQKFGLSDR
jgi:NAD+ kinase